MVFRFGVGLELGEICVIFTRVVEDEAVDRS